MPPLRDLAGQTFSDWTVLHRKPPESGDRYVYWHCLCSCGHEEDVIAQNLWTGRSPHCIHCRHRKRFDEVKLKRLRKAGKTWPEIEASIGISRRTLQRRKKTEFDRSRYDGWVLKHFDEVDAAHKQGVPWVTIATWAPLSDRALVTAYARERARRLADRLVEYEADAVRQTHEMTAQGMSAVAIAERLGVAERTVVRYRRSVVESMPSINIERIQKLLARKLDWGSINRRVGKPFEYGAELEVYYHMTLDLFANAV